MNPSKFFNKSILAKLTFAILLSTFGFSSVVLADHEEEFIAALKAEKYDKAARIFHENNDTIDPNFFTTHIGDAPVTIVELTAKHGQWYLVKRMLKKNPMALTGSLLWLTASDEQWPLFEYILNANPNGDFMHVNRYGRSILHFLIRAKEYPLALRYLELFPNANTDIEDETGETPLYLAARHRNWPLVERMLELNPNANTNAGPLSGPTLGTSVLWIAATESNWQLLLRMLTLNPNANVNAASNLRFPMCSVFNLAARAEQWAIVARILVHNLDADLDQRPKSAMPDKILTPREVILAKAPAHIIKAMMLKEIRTFKAYAPFIWHLRIIEERYSAHQSAVVFGAFRRVASTFPQFDTPRLVEEHSNLGRLPKDPRWLVAMATLRQEDPDLKHIPNHVLTEVLKIFQTAYKLSDYEARQLDVIEAGVLHVLCPVDSRDPHALAECSKAEAKKLTTKRKKIKTIRNWIRAAIADAMLAGHLPANLNGELRARLVATLTQVPFSKLTRTNIQNAIKEFVAVPVAEVTPAQELKRGREDNDEQEIGDGNSHRIRIKLSRPDGNAATAVAPNGNIREGLVRDVIRDAPGLDVPRINARVDEMMGGEEQVLPDPMDIEDDAPANSNADYIGDFDGLDPYALTQDAFLQGAIAPAPFFGGFEGSGQL